MFKNVAGQKWVVFAFDRTNNQAKTGDAGQITAKIDIDHAGAGAITDTNPTEIEDGFYRFDLTQGETNGDHLLILPESSTSNIQVIGVPGAVATVPPNFTDFAITSTDGRVDVGEWLGTAVTLSSTTAKPQVDIDSIDDDAAAADNLEAVFDGGGGTITADITGDIVGTLSTCTTNTDMRGTDGANTTVPDAAGTAASLHAITDAAVSGVATQISGLNDLDAAGVWNYVTRALTDKAGFSLAADQSGVTIGTVSSVTTIPDGAIGAAAVADIFSTTTIAEAYAADAAAGTPAQILYQIQQALTEFAISGTTLTVKKLDGSTTASTYTLDSSTAPTSRTRAT